MKGNMVKGILLETRGSVLVIQLSLHWSLMSGRDQIKMA